MIREACVSDVPDILDMGERFVAGNNWPVGFNRDAAAAAVESMILGEQSVIFIADGGMVAGLVFPHYFNGGWTGQELWWWVEPEKRKSSLGIRLLERLEEWAMAMGAETFSMVALESRQPERVGRIYQNRGYIPTEHHYMKVF